MASTKRLKLTSSSLAVEKIADNDDLLLQIPVCLPVKSLLKFKCVSEHWLSLISNPRFSRRVYLSHSPCICALFLQTWSRSTYQINLDCKHSETLSFVGYPPNTKIVQSCNGLLLCCDIPTDRAESMYSVYNPTTRQCATVPPPSLTGEVFGFFLAFDPLKSTEYKVICVFQEEIEEPDSQIGIYSSKSGNWRASEARFSLDLDCGMYDGVFWNGGIHWDTDFGPCLYLDVEKEQIKEMPMPNPKPEDWSRRRVWYFGESRGHLHLTKIYHAPSTQFDVWELKKYYSGWFRKYRVDLGGLAREYPGMIRDYLDPSSLNYYAFKIPCIVEGETEEESYMVLHIPGNIIRYDFKTRNVKKICDFPPSYDNRENETAGNFSGSSGYQYIESLVCV